MDSQQYSKQQTTKKQASADQLKRSAGEGTTAGGIFHSIADAISSGANKLVDAVLGPKSTFHFEEAQLDGFFSKQSMALKSELSRIGSKGFVKGQGQKFGSQCKLTGRNKPGSLARLDEESSASTTTTSTTSTFWGKKKEQIEKKSFNISDAAFDRWYNKQRGARMSDAETCASKGNVREIAQQLRGYGQKLTGRNKPGSYSYVDASALHNEGSAKLEAQSVVPSGIVQQRAEQLVHQLEGGETPSTIDEAQTIVPGGIVHQMTEKLQQQQEHESASLNAGLPLQAQRVE